MSACISYKCIFFPQGGIMVDGRKLLISLAVTTNKAQSLKKDKETEKQSKDNRNLWLAREGSELPQLYS